jgi:hypothetical protein
MVMSQISVTQLDSLLNFSRLHLLIFTPKWKLAGVHPNHRSFLGWDENDFEAFRFNYNFLEPNNLDVSAFLGHFQNKTYVTRKYYWRDSEKNISGPFETYFRIIKEGGQIKMIMAFVKISNKAETIQVPPQDKSKVYITKGMPGYIKNILNPLALMVTRLEILKDRNSHSKDLEILFKLSRKLEYQLQLLNYKMFRNNLAEPTSLDLNNSFKEEFLYLKSDQFFNHHVRKNIKFHPEIPKTRVLYSALMGVFYEFYYFLRKFVSMDQEYLLQFETIRENNNIGFHANFIGDFHVPAELDLHFPWSLEGDSQQISLDSIDGLDIPFMAYCLTKISGTIEMVCRRDMMTLRLILPLQMK